MRNKILIALVATSLLSSPVNAWSWDDPIGITIMSFGAAVAGLAIGVPLLTVETNALGYGKCPSEITICSTPCIYKDCPQCHNTPVLTRCSSGNNGTFYSPTCDKDSILGCNRSDTFAEVGLVFQRYESPKNAGIAFIVIGSVAGVISFLSAGVAGTPRREVKLG